MGNATPSWMLALTATSGSLIIFEAFIAFACIIFAIVFFVGSKKNTELAMRFARAFEQACGPEFANVGLKQSNGEVTTFLKDGASRFLSYATGRVNCKGITAVLELSPRMDMFAYLKSLWSPILPDRVSFTTQVEEMPDFCMWLVTKKRWRKLKNNFEDSPMFKHLDLITQECRFSKKLSDALPSNNYIALAEHGEVLDAAVGEKVASLIKKVGPSLREIFVADVECAWDIYGRRPDKGILRVEVCLSENEVESTVTAALQLAVALVDGVSRMKMSPKAVSKCEQVRSKAKAAQRDEELRQRREELAARKSRDEEERLEREAKLPRKQQEKLERRRRRAEQRSKMAKMTRKG